MKQLLLDIKARLTSQITDLRYCAIYNGQPEKIKNNETDENGYYPFDSPACFIEAVNPNEIAQLGNGVQIYDPLTIRIHIYYVELDSMDGYLDENKSVFDFKQKVYLALQKYQFNGAATMVRNAENLDYNHDNVYIYTVDFITNYIDQAASEPVGGQEVPASVPQEVGKVQLITDTQYE